MTVEPVSLAATDDVARDTPASRFPAAAYRSHMEAGEIDELLEFFTEDAVARPLGTDLIRFQGKEKLKALWNAVLEAGDLKFTEEFRSHDTIVIFFDVKYALGTFEAIDVLRINEDGKCREVYALARPYKSITLFTGRVVMAFARQGGGFLHRLLIGLLVWPLEIAQRVGEPFGARIVEDAMKRGIERSRQR